MSWSKRRRACRICGLAGLAMLFGACTRSIDEGPRPPASVLPTIIKPAPFPRPAVFVPKTKTEVVAGTIIEYDDYGTRNGTAEAEADIAAGDVRLLVFGLPANNRREQALLLRDEAGVTIEVIAGCVVSDALRAFARQYNEVSMRHIEARFGTGYLASVGKRTQEAEAPAPGRAEDVRP